MNESDNDSITIQETEEQNNLMIDQIPLKVKPAKSPKRPPKYQQKELLKFKIFSNIKIVVVILLLIINIFLIINIAIKLDNNQTNVEPFPNTLPKISSKTSILGQWKTKKESLFQFNDDYNFYWYDSYIHKLDNYYSGTYTYKSGAEALEEMGYTEEEFKITFGQNVDIKNAYSIYLNPKVSFKGGLNSTEKDLNEDETWWFILIIKDEKNAIGYNKTLDLRYDLTRS